MFFRIAECDKFQETMYKSQKDTLIIDVELIISFLRPRRLLKTQVFEKNAILPMEKYLRHSFLVLSNLTNLKEQL